MNYKKLAVVTGLALTLVLGVMIFGGRRTRAAGPVCTVPGDYSTIQGAVNDPSCTTINVAAGTYNEQVTISRTLTLNGAQHGVDARTRVPTSESIINSSCGPVQIFADSVVLDGFTIQGSTQLDPCFIAGIYTNPGSHNADVGGYQILNNIVQNNIIGIEMDNTGALQAKVQRNLIQNNNVSPGPDSGTGIDTNFGAHNVIIDSNKFAGNKNSGMGDFSGGSNSLTVSNNEFVGNRRAIGWISVASSSITKNNIHNSTDSATADIRLFGAVSGLTITCNDITNGAGRGIRMDDAFSAGPNSNITINSNNIAGNAVAGLVVDHLSYAGILNAQGNWWGSATGPTIASNPGGTGDKIVDPDSIVMYKPFLTSPSSCAPVPQIGPPTNKDQCKNGGWQTFNTPHTFKNQGDCIQFVNTGK